jgi:hypothetical protein
MRAYNRLFQPSHIERPAQTVKTTPFSLVKWYMDCVTDRGEAAIFYCANLHRRGVHASLGNLLYAPADHEASSAISIGRFTVSDSPNQISVDHPRLKFKGCWQTDSPPFRSTVFEAPEGSVVWNCIQPRAQVSLTTPHGEFTGLGYAECLNITISPWLLPLKELRWGRFVSADHTLVWIDWQGPYLKRLVILDSVECPLDRVSDSEVLAGPATLRIEPGRSLRNGRLRSTILPGASALRRLLPRSLFNIDEQKWLSRGTLTISGQTCTGWTIHEVVRWEL